MSARTEAFMAKYIAAIVKKATTFFNMCITSPSTWCEAYGFGQVVVIRLGSGRQILVMLKRFHVACSSELGSFD